jgi:hypothetical protein
MYVSTHLGEFQHTLSETLGLLLLAKQVGKYWYVNTKVLPQHDVVYQNVLKNNQPNLLVQDAIEH